MFYGFVWELVLNFIFLICINESSLEQVSWLRYTWGREKAREREREKKKREREKDREKKRDKDIESDKIDLSYVNKHKKIVSHYRSKRFPPSENASLENNL